MRPAHISQAHIHLARHRPLYPTIFTDGSYHRDELGQDFCSFACVAISGRGPAGVVGHSVAGGWPRHLGEPPCLSANTAEHLALYWALRFAEAHPRVIIRSDSLTAIAATNFTAHGTSPLISAIQSTLLYLTEGLGHHVEVTHVKGHTGDPGNEMADHYAKEAAHTPLGWLDVALPVPTPWCWAHQRQLRGDPSLPATAHDQLHCGAPTPPTPACRPGPPDGSKGGSLQLQVATYNVRTLSLTPEELLLDRGSQARLTDFFPRPGGPRQALRQAFSAKQHTLAEAFGAHTHVLALQEARTTAGSRRVGSFLALSSGCAGSPRSLGVEVWINTGIPWGRRRGRVSQEQVRVLHATPRLLVVQVRAPCVRLRIVAGHAPCAATAQAELRAWWSSAARWLEGSRTVFLLDANARWCPPDPRPADLLFAGAMRHVGFTLALRQSIAPPVTWYGHGLCATAIDHVLVPERGPLTAVAYRSAPELGLHQLDHVPLAATLEVAAENRFTARKWRPPRPHVEALADSALAARFAGVVSQLQPAPWSIPIEEHYKDVSQLYAAAVHCLGTSGRSPCPVALPPAVHRLIAVRKCLFLHSLRQRGYRTRHPVTAQQVDYARHTVDPGGTMSLPQLLKAATRAIATATDNGKQALTAQLVAEAGASRSPQHTWRLIRRIQCLSGAPSRRRAHPRLLYDHADRKTPCATHEAAQTALARHFGTTEHASCHTATALCARHAEWAANRPPAAPDPPLPTLAQWTTLLAHSPTRKALPRDGIPGELLRSAPQRIAAYLFPLVLKGLAANYVPLEWHHGLAVAIPKKAKRHDVPEAFRSIQITSLVHKATQRFLRAQLRDCAARLVGTQQSGTLPGRGLDVAAAKLHAATAAFAAAGRPSFTLFIDIKQAFYTVAHRMLLANEPWDEAEDVPACVAPLRRLVLRAPGALDHAEVPCALRAQLAAELHTPWWTVDGVEGLYVPDRGTRPGTPLADLLFALVFGPIVRDIMDTLGSADEALSLPAETPWGAHGGMPAAAAVSFFDDLALVVSPATNEALAPRIQSTLAVVQRRCKAAGLDLSAGRAKTAVLLAPLGKGARRARQELCGRGADATICSQDGFEAPIVDAYIHLGTSTSARREFTQDLAARVASHNAATRALGSLTARGHPVIARNAYSACCRSLLLYNLHTWPSLGKTSCNRLQTCHNKAVNRLLRCPDPQAPHWNLAGVGLPPPVMALHPRRLRLARKLLLLAHGEAAPFFDLLWRRQRAWMRLLLRSIDWLRVHTAPVWPPADDMESWAPLLRHHAPLGATWRTHLSAAQEEALYRAEGEAADLAVTRALREVFDPPSGRDTPAVASYPCRHCPRLLPSLAALRRHEGQHCRSSASWEQHVWDTRCYTCGKEYWSRARVLRHMASSRRHCREAHVAFFPAMSEEVAQQYAAEQLAEDQAARRAGRCPRAATSPAVRVSQAGIPAVYGVRLPERRGQPLVWTLPQPSATLSAIPRPQQDQTAYVLSLYGGHSRQGDIRSHWLELYGDASGTHFITIDLVHARRRDDLAQEENVRFWLSLVERGKVIALMAAPPCESWSAARLRPGGPPPLRGPGAFWGLPLLARRHRQQVRLANVLMVAAWRLFSAVARTGHPALLEHPAASQAAGAASIWRVPAVARFLASPRSMTVTVDQCMFGQPFKKPTVLAAVNAAAFREHLSSLPNAGRCWHVTHEETLQGKGADGAFKTAAAKAYPSELCRALAVGLQPGSAAPVLRAEEVDARLAPYELHAGSSAGPDYAPQVP